MILRQAEAAARVLMPNRKYAGNCSVIDDMPQCYRATSRRYVRHAKVPFFSGCETRPETFAPDGSNGTSHPNDTHAVGAAGTRSGRAEYQSHEIAVADDASSARSGNRESQLLATVGILGDQ
ncbi:MAG: hypothetical protein CAPSK01_003167 [Candidatus Accumulibacter vicinus]|uniref:Uncharacterized protein n=1 Tax=Candidatus Accumulibacter vicinus TaxID=2954382 RepID=A0A084XY64_9PROT|nr:MAG: hypothetical protein CAPSK01_003167 [Candidatus Accumulibacter vicinus]